MRRRVLLFFGVLGLLAAGAGEVAVLLKTANRIALENYQEVRPGMTSEEVATLLAGPPDDYRTGEVELDLDIRRAFQPAAVPPEQRQWRQEFWEGDQGTLRVVFDGEDRVRSTMFTPGG